MPGRKKENGKTEKNKIPERQKKLTIVRNNLPMAEEKRAPINLKVVLGGVAVVLLGLIIYLNKSFFIAGMVNGQPIWTAQVNQKLNVRYGQQVFDELVNEKLITTEAQKKNITVSDKEIKDKMAEVEKSLGGAKLSDVLKQQGLTQADFTSQIRLRIMLDKMLGDKVKVSDKEVSDYVEKNKASLTGYIGSDEKALADYARNTLQSQKENAAISTWFNDIRSKAKIEEFVKF